MNSIQKGVSLPYSLASNSRFPETETAAGRDRFDVASVPLWWGLWLSDQRLRKWKLQHNVTFVVCHHHRSRK